MCSRARAWIRAVQAGRRATPRPAVARARMSCGPPSVRAPRGSGGRTAVALRGRRSPRSATRGEPRREGLVARGGDSVADVMVEILSFPGLSVRSHPYCTNMCSLAVHPTRHLRPASFRLPAAVAELVYAHGSGPCGRKPLEVRVLSAALEQGAHSRGSAAGVLEFVTTGANPSGITPPGARATASPFPRPRARPPPGFGRRASASPTRGDCGRFPARGIGPGRGRRRSRVRVRRRGLRARGG